MRYFLTPALLPACVGVHAAPSDRHLSVMVIERWFGPQRISP
jgi:hypothetical protein